MPAVVPATDPDFLTLLLRQRREEVASVRAAQRSLRDATISLFTGGVVAIAFLTPVIVGRRLPGSPWLPWTFGSLAVALSLWFGTLCGLLMYKPMFRADGDVGAALERAVGDLEELVTVTSEELQDARVTLCRAQAAFGQMIRVMWFALVSWIVLAVCAALGVAVASGVPRP